MMVYELLPMGSEFSQVWDNSQETETSEMMAGFQVSSGSQVAGNLLVPFPQQIPPDWNLIELGVATAMAGFLQIKIINFWSQSWPIRTFSTLYRLAV